MFFLYAWTNDREYADISLDLPTSYHKDVDMGRKKPVSPFPYGKQQGDNLLPSVDRDSRKGDMDRAPRVVNPKQ